MANYEEEAYDFTDEDVDKFMEAAVKLVQEAGEMIIEAMANMKGKRFVLKDEDCKEGNASSILTETDTAVEKHLMKGLSALFPDHCFIGEEDISASPTEMVERFTNAPTWIIDPIDGTMNFVHRNPLVCTSVGLTINRKLVAGIVNSPVTGHLYTAIKGRGAFLNGKEKLQTSGAKRLKEAMIIMELPAGANDTKRGVAVNNVTNLLTKVHSLRCPG